MLIMSEQNMTPLQVPTFFSERAFSIVRPEASGIAYDPEAWLGVAGLAQSIVRNSLPPLQNTAVVFRYAVPGFNQPRDPSVHAVNEFEPLFYADRSLELSATETPEKLARSVIMDSQGGAARRPFEITITDGDLVGGLIKTLAEPPVEEQALLAPPSAWLRVLTGPNKACQDKFAGLVRDKYSHVIQKVPRTS